MLILVDTREKAKAIEKILQTFDKLHIQHDSTKLYVGDYQTFDNPKIVVDRKQNLSEVCNNVCQGHERFTAELKRAQDAGIHLVILVEHGGKIKTLSDVAAWYNPRLKVSPKAMKGKQLYAIMHTLAQKYDCEWKFCTKAETGKEIVKLLKGDSDGRKQSSKRKTGVRV